MSKPNPGRVRALTTQAMRKLELRDQAGIPEEEQLEVLNGAAATLRTEYRRNPDSLETLKAAMVIDELIVNEEMRRQTLESQARAQRRREEAEARASATPDAHAGTAGTSPDADPTPGETVTGTDPAPGETVTGTDPAPASTRGKRSRPTET